MNGTGIIALARDKFGEPTAATVTTTTELSFLNEALREIYNDLSPDRLKKLINEDTITITAGKGPILSNWDRVIEAYVNGTPAIRVPREMIENTSISPYFEPLVPIFHIDELYIWIRPSTAGTVTVSYLSPPSTISSGQLGTEITEIHAAFHEAVASLMASYMYAQEEDITQAQYYKNEYLSVIRNIDEVMAAEA